MKIYGKIFVPMFAAIIAGLLTIHLTAPTDVVSGQTRSAQSSNSNTPPFGGPHGRPGGLNPRVLEQLNLTDAQKTQIKTLMDASRTGGQQYFDQVRTADQSLRALVESGNFDETQARQLLTSKAAAQTELEFNRLKTDAAIYNLLTADQKAQLKTLKTERDGRRGERGERGQDGPPQN